MQTICKDAVFGEMTYKHRWFKEKKIELFGKEWDIVVAAKAYSGKPITDAERNSYKAFMENESEMKKIIGDQLTEYVNKNVQDFSLNWIGARSVNRVTELAQMVKPRSLLFKQDGTTVLLLDCVWDEEIGVAVKLMPDIAVGPQDLFL